MNVTAGVGGPAVVLYAISSKWAHERFVATAQLYFVGLNVISLGAVGYPHLAPSTWLVVTVCLALGLFIGHKSAYRISAQAGRNLAIGVALAGAMATVARGVATL